MEAGEYRRLACSVILLWQCQLQNFERMSDLLIIQMACQVRQVTKDACSEQHGSILHDCHGAVKCFSWRTVWLEMLDMHKKTEIINYY